MDKYLFIQTIIIVMALITIVVVYYMQYVIDKLVKENEELKRGVGK